MRCCGLDQRVVQACIGELLEVMAIYRYASPEHLPRYEVTCQKVCIAFYACLTS